MVRFSAKPKNEPHSLPRASEARADAKNAFKLCPSLKNYLSHALPNIFGRACDK
ncbi:MAG: hypothetical protein U5L45_08460 [Saprospiraceae bacterium]|nr:hypothetical protein [Saprospiraceae bacterium]